MGTGVVPSSLSLEKMIGLSAVVPQSVPVVVEVEASAGRLGRGGAGVGSVGAAGVGGSSK